MFFNAAPGHQPVKGCQAQGCAQRVTVVWPPGHTDESAAAGADQAKRVRIDQGVCQLTRGKRQGHWRGGQGRGGFDHCLTNVSAFAMSTLLQLLNLLVQLRIKCRPSPDRRRVTAI